MTGGEPDDGCFLLAGWGGSEQEVALGHGEDGGGFAGEEDAVGADLVGFGIYLDVGGGVVVDHVGFADAAAGVADGGEEAAEA